MPCQTADESTGTLYTLNGIGTMLSGTRWNPRGLAPCPSCGSVIQIKWFGIAFGIRALGTYRVLYTRPEAFSGRFIARRLKDDPVTRSTPTNTLSRTEAARPLAPETVQTLPPSLPTMGDNVERYAAFSRRVLAFLIDSMITGGLFALILFIFKMVALYAPTSETRALMGSTSLGLFCIVAWLYFAKHRGLSKRSH